MQQIREHIRLIGRLEKLLNQKKIRMTINFT
ncbi:hypothetical protein HBHAL_1489 [Halobacillus halophilus DSM 2266]|uniref:Uncharacterized protein n=1 Tax=Halobacillus halophilus (strain ATCC 35676 / DSM 2266 / JCM 20832 / KCTC 3685 / LMG 17431 / NBRC 102448 / NCIMB 2269) TaxID=866895 RepID=I0JI93_HALH3|nr:hypothetical protein HBHAL_1489 [Halobacillus halophilus DSM 2266]